MKTWHWIVLVLLVLLMATGGTTMAVKKLRKGKRLDEFEAGADGIVRHDPADMARRLGENIDVYALARMIDSEHPGDLDAIRMAVAHIAHNMARHNHQSVSGLLLAGSRKNPKTKKIEHTASNGFFGAQYTGKYATTAHAPTADGLRIAKLVLGGGSIDPTAGALQFDVPRAQRAGYAAKKPGYTKTPEQIAAKRIAAGMEMVLVPGVPEDHFRMWRPKGVA